MPVLSTNDAAKKLAAAVAVAGPTALAEIHSELFPAKAVAVLPPVGDLVRHVRDGLEPEEIVDLWNVVYPADRNVWYDEETKTIHYNEWSPEYAE